jgi:tRNA (mo5U34)-methyltransferase
LKASLAFRRTTRRIAKGGSTDIALVLSLNSLLYLLKTFGFSEATVLPSGPDDYEQFRRGCRVIVYGAKA